MRFPNRFFSWKPTRQNAARPVKSSGSRVSRFESLETRDLLSLSTSSADYKALVAAKSFGDSEENAIWVTSLTDVVSSTDGKITLREALDYAGQSLTAGNVSTTIRFSVGGTIKLSATAQSLKILSKSVTIDATDVGGVTIKASGTLALYIFGGTTSSPVNVTLTDVAITGGSTTGTESSPSKGAAIQVAANCNLTMNNCSVVNNTSSSALGVGIYIASGALTLNDVVFSGNTTTGESSKGGAIYLDAGSLNATNVVFADNAAADGGAIFLRNGAATLTNCYFHDNTASNGNGGALSASSELTISNTSFRSNSSVASGGAIYVTGDALSTFDGVIFTDNFAHNGGAVAQNGQQITVSNAEFSLNEASENGGAVYVELNALMLAENASFLGNLAGENGGALYNAGSFYLTTGKAEENESRRNGGALYSVGYFEIRDANFQKNAAGNYGGSIYLSGAQRSWFLQSSASNSTAYEGAGIYTSGALTIAGSSVSKNVASASGGGVSNSGNLLVSDSQIENNIASGLNAVGGGVLNYVNATLNVSDTKFVGNESTSGSGGAIANSGAATLDAVTVMDNKAALFGGGVYNSGTVESQYSTYASNAASDGGAIADVYGSSSNFISSTLWGNVASSNGGALYTYGTTVFQSSTIAYNVASSLLVAAYYSPTGADGPSFDSTTTVASNFADYQIEETTPCDAIVVSDAKTGEIIGGRLLFDAAPVNGSSVVKTLSLTNTSARDLKLSDFTALGNAESTVLSYALYDANGQVLDINSDFVLSSGETATLKITVAPKKVGSKYIEFVWTASELNESGSVVAGSETEFSIGGAANITKLASSTTSVATLESATSYNISVNEDGSFNINLSKSPSSNVILYLTASDDSVVLSTDVLLFTTANYNTPQTVTVGLDKSKLDGSSAPTKVSVYPQLLTYDANYRGATFAEVTLSVADYIVLQDDCSVDVNAVAPAGVSRWDFNGDGVIDAITSGTEYWINKSDVSGDVINYKRTKSGVTTTTEVGVVYSVSAPSASADVTTFSAIPGVVRVSLEAEDGAVARWRVNWGDGSPCSEIDNLSTSEVFAHAYEADGSYTISIELVDANGVGNGIWTELSPIAISGVNATSAVYDDAAELFDELLSEDVIDAILPDE